MTRQELSEKTRKIAREIDKRLAENHMAIVISMKRSGEEYSIVQLRSHELMVHTGRGTNEIGETIWKTKVGVFKDSYKLASYIMQIQ